MTYEYQCNDCGRRFEIKATIAEKERGLRLECPNCRSASATQVLSGVNMMTRSGGGNPPCCGPGSGAGCC